MTNYLLNQKNMAHMCYNREPTDEEIDGATVITLDDDRASLGMYWDGITFVSETEESAREIRDEALIKIVDPLVSNQLRWNELTAEKQAEWSQFRTDLLGVPQQAGFPNTITWPTKP